MKKTNFKTIDEYISTFSDEDQKILQQIGETIQKAAPYAKEVISYQMPTYKQNGILVLFSAFKSHFSLFPTPSAVEAFEDKLAGYETSKGTIKFPKEKPIPYDLITEIVKFWVKRNKEKKSKKS